MYKIGFQYKLDSLDFCQKGSNVAQICGDIFIFILKRFNDFPSLLQNHLQFITIHSTNSKASVMLPQQINYRFKHTKHNYFLFASAKKR